MVGIVVVSHSYVLARAAVTLAEEMLQGRQVPIVIAAGLDEETFGTDAVRIAEALVEAGQDGDGVVVLMDLGSAVLSAELALELLADDDARQRVLLCPAPLVEGLVVAAVTALSGAGRAEVAAEAQAALAGKQSQLGSPATGSPPAGIPSIGSARTGTPPSSSTPAEPIEAGPAIPVVDGESDVVSGWFPVTPDHGLHARPAARLIQALQDVDARVELRNRTTESGWVPGASLSRLATLGALRGHDVEVRAAGPQAGEAVQRLLALARRNFDEHEPRKFDPPTTDNGTPERIGGPFPASPGIGIGPARRVDVSRSRPFNSAGPSTPATPSTSGPDLHVHPSSQDPAEGRRRLDRAIDTVRAQVQQIRTRVARDVGEGEAAIFDAHLALLADPELLESARSRIGTGQAADGAWANAVSVAAAGYESLTDPYLQARAADVRALGNQVGRYLLDGSDPTASTARPAERPATGPSDGPLDELSGAAGGVLVAEDLTPTEAATLDPERVVAVVLAFGSPTAHSAILIRARGIPAVVGAGADVLDIADGTPLAVDGTTGDLVVDPSEMVVAGFRKRAAAAQTREREARARAGAPAITRDGVGIPVGANVGSMPEARAAAESGADLIGLVRTEFLFLGRAQAPDVDEQISTYRSLAEAVAGQRITLRSLDVGGDKPLAYLPQAAETNPFLGVRGIRLALQRPELLADQLLAMVTVAHEVPVSVLFPMVSTLDELLRARLILDEAIKRAGHGQPAGLQVGIMIEVPAAALKAGIFAPHVDFLSIGTNDLTQYALAAERGNNAITRLADPLDPGVLRLIDATCRGAGPRTTVAVCGELAADDRAVGVLLGLGVRELSVTPHAVPGIKQAVRALLLPETETLATRALNAPSADAVRALLPL